MFNPLGVFKRGFYVDDLLNYLRNLGVGNIEPEGDAGYFTEEDPEEARRKALELLMSAKGGPPLVSSHGEEELPGETVKDETVTLPFEGSQRYRPKDIAERFPSGGTFNMPAVERQPIEEVPVAETLLTGALARSISDTQSRDYNPQAGQVLAGRLGELQEGRRLSKVDKFNQLIAEKKFQREQLQNPPQTQDQKDLAIAKTAMLEMIAGRIKDISASQMIPEEAVLPGPKTPGIPGKKQALTPLVIGFAELQRAATWQEYFSALAKAGFTEMIQPPPGGVGVKTAADVWNKYK